MPGTISLFVSPCHLTHQDSTCPPSLELDPWRTGKVPDRSLHLMSAITLLSEIIWNSKILDTWWPECELQKKCDELLLLLLLLLRSYAPKFKYRYSRAKNIMNLKWICCLKLEHQRGEKRSRLIFHTQTVHRHPSLWTVHWSWPRDLAENKRLARAVPMSCEDAGLWQHCDRGLVAGTPRPGPHCRHTRPPPCCRRELDFRNKWDVCPFTCH